MTTQINIVVDEGGLIQRNKEQTDGNRWLTLEKNGQKLTARRSKEVRDQELARQGKAPDGKPQSTTPAQSSFRRDEPAVQRQLSRQTLSMACLFIKPNDLRADTTQPAVYEHPYAQAEKFYGENAGISVWICSLDGSFWLSDIGVANTQAPSGFAPGDDTSKLAEIQSGSFASRSDNIRAWTHQTIFPAGDGDIVVVLRHSQAYSCNAAQLLVVNGQRSTVSLMNKKAGPIVTYVAYYVSKSSVKKIPVPSGAISFFDRKFLSLRMHDIGFLRIYNGVLSGMIEESLTPRYTGTVTEELGGFWFPRWHGESSQAFQDNTYGNFSMQFSRGLINYGDTYLKSTTQGTPYIYARIANTNADIEDYIPDVSPFTGGIWLFDYSFPDPWSKYSTAQGEAGPISSAGAFKSRPVRLVINDPGDGSPDYLWFFPSDKSKLTLSLQYPANQQVYYSNTTTNWSFSVPAGGWTTANGIKLSGSDTPATLKFSNPSPYPSSLASTVATQYSYHEYLLVCSDWGIPRYCRQQLLALGFTAADLTP